jgi:hypothetical protein
MIQKEDALRLTGFWNDLTVLRQTQRVTKGTLQTLKNLAYAVPNSAPICSGHWESNERFPVLCLSPLTLECRFRFISLFCLMWKGTQELYRSTEGHMRHSMRWNAATRRWFGLNRGRTSDHTTVEGAKEEFNQSECEVPSAEVRKSSIEHE